MGTATMGTGVPVDLIPDSLQVVLAFAAAFLTATLATPRLREAAIRFGIVDRPDGRLKNHREPVPYLGGLGVALGVLMSLGVTYQFDHQVLATLLGGAVVLVLGLIDDLGSLRPWSKLAGQLLAAFILVKAGVRIQLAFLPSWIAIALTIAWVLAVTNAFNLLDVMDGLSSGVAAVAAMFFGGIAWTQGHVSTAFLAAALAGALLGFRRFNAHPARIYLGDTGSLFIGFLLAAVSLVNSYTRLHLAGALVPLVILAVPLFDMVFVMFVRWRRGAPVMRGSPDHVALRLRKRGWSTKAIARLGAATGIAAGTAAVTAIALPLHLALGILAAAALLSIAFAAWIVRIEMRP